MALFGNRVKETTDTTGTGTLDLNGAPTGFRGFADEFTTLDSSISYLIVDDPDNPTEYEIGKGTFTTGTPNTFARDTVEGSSNSGAKVSWTAGTKTIIATPTAADFDNISGAGIQTWAKGADIASASPLVLGSDGNYFDVTGTTGFAAITVAAGVLFMIQFDGALTLTHHATNLNLPGGANITTAAGDRLIGFATGANTVHVLAYTKADGNSVTGIKQGTHTIWVPASAMYAATTNGAASASVDSGAQDVEYKVLDFDTTTQEFAHFAIRFPKSWNLGTVTFIPHWTAASGSGGVVWALQGVALSNDDALDTAFGTEQTSTDTLITAADLHVGPTSAAITIGGTPAAADEVFFRIKRNVSDGSDTLGVDARLLGVVILFTINAGDDA